MFEHGQEEANVTRRVRRFVVVAIALAATGGLLSCDSGSSGPTSPPQFVEPSSAEVRLGQTVQFRESSSQRLGGWSVLEGPGHGIVSEQGLYRAPFIRPAGSGATVVAEFRGFDATASVEFGPSPPDPLDCCGPGQSHLPYDEWVYVDELPEPVVRVAPSYPDSAREAGVSGTVVLLALVCSTGQVYDVKVDRSIPMLDAAAIAALQQWVFSPARVDGQPIAVWVVVPFRFSLHEPPSAPVSVLAITQAPSRGRSSGR